MKWKVKGKGKMAMTPKKIYFPLWLINSEKKTTGELRTKCSAVKQLKDFSRIINNTKNINNSFINTF